MFSLFRFLNRFLFCEEKKKQYYSTYKICIPLYCSWSDEESVSKEDSECWLILLAQEYRIFSQELENKNLFQILPLTGFCIEGPNWQIVT